MTTQLRTGNIACALIGVWLALHAVPPVRAGEEAEARAEAGEEEMEPAREEAARAAAENGEPAEAEDADAEARAAEDADAQAEAVRADAAQDDAHAEAAAEHPTPEAGAEKEKKDPGGQKPEAEKMPAKESEKQPKKQVEKQPEKKPAVRVREPVHFSMDKPKPWSIPNWCDGGALAPAKTSKTEGEAGLRMVAKRPKQGKLVLGRAVKDLHLEDFSRATVDVLVEQERSCPALLTLAFQLPGDAGWVESPPRLLEQGWNEGIAFDLYEPAWKSKATKWTYKTTPLGKGKPGHVYLLVHGLDYQESVVLDNLRLALAEGEAKVPEDAALAGEAGRLPAVETRKQETVDLTRADQIRAYVCETLNSYAASLQRAGRAEEAQRIARVVSKAAESDLVARAMPVPKPKKPAKPKPDKPKKPEAKKPEPKKTEPKPRQAKRTEPAKPEPAVAGQALRIRVPASGNVELEGKPMRTYFLKFRLRALAEKDADRPVRIGYEPGTVLAKVTKVQTLCKDAGFSDVKLVEASGE